MERGWPGGGRPREGEGVGAGVWAALAAAACYAVATPLQHLAASGAATNAHGLRLLWQLSHRPVWMAGIGLNAFGLLLHAAALRSGTLVVVQPLLVSALVFALPVRAALDRRLPSADTVAWAALTAAGLAVFLVVANPAAGHAQPNQPVAASLLFAGMALAALGSLVAAKAGTKGGVGGFALGLASGVLYGLVAGALKMTTAAAGGGALGLLTSWPLYALALVGAWGLAVNQRAYQAAPLAVSLPALTVADPLVGIVFGAIVFGEYPADSPEAVVLEGLGVAVMTVGVVALARLEAHRAARAAATRPKRRPPGTASGPTPLPAASPGVLRAPTGPQDAGQDRGRGWP